MYIDKSKIYYSDVKQSKKYNTENYNYEQHRPHQYYAKTLNVTGDANTDPTNTMLKH